MGSFKIERVKEGLQVKRLKEFEDFGSFYYDLIDDLEPLGIYLECSQADGRYYLVDTETKKVYGGEEGYTDLIYYLFNYNEDVIFEYIFDVEEFLEDERELKEVYEYLI